MEEGKITKNGFRKTKKPSKKELEAKIYNLESKLINLNEKINNDYIEKNLLFEAIFSGEDFKSIYFADIGTGISICKDFVVVTSNFHQHIWNRSTGDGYSLPSIYLEQFINIANDHINDIEDKNSKDELFYSFKKLKNTESLDYNDKLLITMIERFLNVANDGVYAIGNDIATVCGLMLGYFSIGAKIDAFTKERDHDLSRNDFYNEFISSLRFFALDIKIDKDLLEELKEKVFEIEEDAYNKIKNFIQDKGGSLGDTIDLPKRSGSEAKALAEMQDC